MALNKCTFCGGRGEIRTIGCMARVCSLCNGEGMVDSKDVVAIRDKNLDKKRIVNKVKGK